MTAIENCFKDLGPYKGSNGKIGVIGGCFEYTGAPFYAAVSSLRSGSDLAHIFCTKSAGVPIKSYSPEIIVHPTLASSQEDIIPNFEDHANLIAENTTKWFPAIHSLVIGPGLGRDRFLTDHLVPKLWTSAVNQSKNYLEKLLVIDADGINILLTHQNLLSGYKDAVLTPNIIEFGRLWEAYMTTPVPKFNIQEPNIAWKDPESLEIRDVISLSQKIGSFLLIKGQVDIITDGQRCLCIGSEGSQKRCGGQGDILSGVISTCLYNAQKNNTDFLQAIALACMITRRSGLLAFRKKGRGLTAPDMIKALPKALSQVLGEFSL